MSLRLITKFLICFICLLVLNKANAQNEEKNGTESDLSSFSCKWIDNLIVIHWYSEQKDITGFTIQHSTNSVYFKSIVFLKNKGQNNFYYSAKAYNAGANYFRIIQHYKDGTIAKSKLVSVMCGYEGAHNMEIEHIKFSVETDLSLQVKKRQRIILEIINEEGRVIADLYKGEMAAEEIIFRTISANKLDKGIYYISARGEYFRESKKITVE